MASVCQERITLNGMMTILQYENERIVMTGSCD